MWTRVSSPGVWRHTGYPSSRPPACRRADHVAAIADGVGAANGRRLGRQAVDWPGEPRHWPVSPRGRRTASTRCGSRPASPGSGAHGHAAAVSRGHRCGRRNLAGLHCRNLQSRHAKSGSTGVKPTKIASRAGGGHCRERAWIRRSKPLASSLQGRVWPHTGRMAPVVTVRPADGAPVH
jgi:hypothetical protein